MRVVSDVDLTILDTCFCKGGWVDTLYKTGAKINYDLLWDDISKKSIDYSLSKYVTDTKDQFDFWRGTGVYDGLKPYPEAEYYLNKISEDFDLVFLSAIKGSHNKSKYYFLKRYFPLMKAYIATKEKEEVLRDGDFFIDDRNNNINNVYTDTVLVRYNTLFTQDEDLTTSKEVIKTSDWGDIYKSFLKYANR